MSENNLPELLRIIAYPSMYRKDLEAAADLIESLQAQLEQKTNEAEGMRSNWYKCIENLKESQRRADAAVEDMKLIVDAVREAHCDETCCFACAFDCDTSINDSGVPNCECPGFERDDCFEWRGVKAENKCAQS